MSRFNALEQKSRRRVRTDILICALCLFAFPALAQAGQSAPVSESCAPVRSPATGNLEPVFAPSAIPQPLAGLLISGYRRHYQLNQIAASTALLQDARKQAVSEGNTCAQALAVYGLA